MATRSVTVKEGAQSGGAYSLKFFQGGPASDKGIGQRGGEILEEFEHERVVKLQRSLQTLQSLGPLIDKAPPILAVLGALTHRHTLRTVAAQPGVVFEQELAQQGSVDWIALCSGRIKRLAVALQAQRLDRVEVDKVKGAQEVDEGAFALLDGNSDATAGKTLLQRADPLDERISFVFQGGELGRRLLLAWKGHCRQGMFLIGPVDADDGGIVA